MKGGKKMKISISSIVGCLLLIWNAQQEVSGQETPPQDLYCGDQNCYDGK